MSLHPELVAVIDAGVLGHLVTINADGSPQVSVIWLGRDGEHLLVAHLGAGKKMRNVERDPRVAVSFEAPGANGIGLRNWVVVHGTAEVVEGGASALLRELAPRFLGPDTVFPGDDVPAGRIMRISVERVAGVGPWA